MTHDQRERLPDIKEIVERLCQKAEDVCFELFPHGSSTIGKFANFRIGSLAGDDGQSLRVQLVPNGHNGKVGCWADFATGENGDIYDLIAQVKYGGDKKAAFHWALDFLNIQKMDANKYREMKREGERHAKERAKAAEKENRRKKGISWKIWMDGASPNIRDTPVEHYLNERDIDLDRAPSTGALRFHPGLKVPEREWVVPAMVAIVASVEGKFLGIHRTFLIKRDNGKWDRLREDIDGVEGKFCLGAIRGGYISLSKGANGRTISKAKHGESVVMLEGIENGLLTAIACPDHHVISCLNLGNFAFVRLPANINNRTLLLDNDTHPQALAGAEVAKAAQAQFAANDGNDISISVTKMTGTNDVNSFVSAALHGENA